MASSAPSDRPNSVHPVFILHRSLPHATDKYYTVREICGACEKRTGHDTIIGAQKIGALWRIYPRNSDARANLLISGITLRGVSVSLCDKNPFLIQSPNGDTVNTTRLVISNVPISFSDKELLEMVIKVGGKPRSDLYLERDRDDDGKLTRWLTGRRFVYIEVPPTPLPGKIDIGPFKASLFHREQKENRTPTCGKCLRQGHTTAQCDSAVVCFDCKKAGHKKGSPDCQHMETTLDSNNQSGASASCSDVIEGNTVPGDVSSGIPPEGSSPSKQPRASRATHQTSLVFPRRHRSYTPSSRKRSLTSPSAASPGKSQRVTPGDASLTGQPERENLSSDTHG